jgi:hypothetical protein
MSSVEFRIADTFTDSLARLTAEEQKAAKTTAFDLQMDSSNPGLSFHKLDKARDRNFWSVRVSRDIRIIVHKTQSSLLLCYVDHHDKAYGWAERRRLETHPKTGAAQMVELVEITEEIRVPRYAEGVTRSSTAKPPNLLFSGLPDDVLLGFGVPRDWVEAVRRATEDSILELAEHLPGEAAEALLEVATGGQPKLAPLPEPSFHAFLLDKAYPSIVDEMPEQAPEVRPGAAVRPLPAEAEALAFQHPDAQRRFRTIESAEELQRALEFPW